MLELYSIGREMLRIPVNGYFVVAEFAGKWVLAAWLVIWPLLQAAWRSALRAFRFLERELTPARGVAVVGLVAAIGLFVSQFSDYRGVDVGSDAYATVSNIAPAPQVDLATAGSAHLWLGLPLAVLAAGLIVIALRTRPGLARLLAPLGLVVIAISLIVDLPAGLDAGGASVIYDQVQARLLGGFWTQLSAGAVLLVIGPILASYLEHEKTGRKPASSGRGKNAAGMLKRVRGWRPNRTKVAGSNG